MRFVSWSQTVVDLGVREDGLRMVLAHVRVYSLNHNPTSRTPKSTTVWDRETYRTWILVNSASRIRFFYRLMDCCSFTAPFCWPNTPCQHYFFHAKWAEKEQKKSSKRADDSINEFSSLRRSGKCYDMQKILNVSQRTVGPKLCFGSGRGRTRIWLTKTGNFWIHSRKSL